MSGRMQEKCVQNEVKMKKKTTKKSELNGLKETKHGYQMRKECLKNELNMHSNLKRYSSSSAIMSSSGGSESGM